MVLLETKRLENLNSELSENAQHFASWSCQNHGQIIVY